MILLIARSLFLPKSLKTFNWTIEPNKKLMMVKMTMITANGVSRVGMNSSMIVLLILSPIFCLMFNFYCKLDLLKVHFLNLDRTQVFPTEVKYDSCVSH